jgi:ABC-type transport system involved in cytochrome c biogenesis permease subunit
MERTAHIFCAVFAVAMIGYAAKNMTSKPKSPIDYAALGSLPIQVEGRVKPLSTEAADSLRLLSGKSVVRDPAHGRVSKESAVEWYARLLFDSDSCHDDPVFRIDHPDVKEDLELDVNEKMFTLNQLRPKATYVMDKARSINEKAVKERTGYERGLLSLFHKMSVYTSVAQSLRTQDVLTYDDMVLGYRRLMPLLLDLPRDAEKWTSDDQEAVIMLRRLLGIIQDKAATTKLRVIPEGRDKTDGVWLNPYDALILGVGEEKRTESPICTALVDANKAWQLHAAVLRSEHAAAEAKRLSEAGDPDAGEAAEKAAELAKIAEGLPSTEESARDFNMAVGAWQRHIDSGDKDPLAAHVGLENKLNIYDPFYQAVVLYVAAFLLACFAWLGCARVLNNYAAGLVAVALVLHTGGLIARCIITGRPPVTTLYSSALFVGWCSVVAGLALEWVYRKGYGVIIATALATLSLLKAFSLAADGSDTMGVLVAVLDTNFWLATHVICITIGYAACFVAAVIGHIYLGRGILTKSLDRKTAKELDTMTYGIFCFGLLFALVGTILGGIWADQSWGRFWGWDPKENGALLICLWLIFSMHGRMGGYIRQRGLAICAVIASIVTTVSWFGVNLLGAGLHSYGFTERGLATFYGFCAIEAGIAAVGLLPMKYWRSADLLIKKTPVEASDADKKPDAEPVVEAPQPQPA